MKTTRKSHSFSSYLFWLLLVLALMACRAVAALLPAPTATLPAKVDSPLQAKLIGQWKLNGSAPWGEATLTFSDDGSLSLAGGLLETEVKGNYFFTAENMIAYVLPTEQGAMTLNFLGDDIIDLIITRSSDTFGLIASAERVK